MNDRKGTQEICASPSRTRPSEAEVTRLFQEAARQYEEFIRLAGLADVTDESESFCPRYSWDNPIGLVVTEEPAGLGFGKN